MCLKRQTLLSFLLLAEGIIFTSMVCLKQQPCPHWSLKSVLNPKALESSKNIKIWQRVDSKGFVWEMTLLVIGFKKYVFCKCQIEKLAAV